eukprot:SAG22_NODE_19714_length_272_cov_0.786127_1_plen_41_part_10
MEDVRTYVAACEDCQRNKVDSSPNHYCNNGGNDKADERVQW